MYERFFNLEEKPFNLTPSPRFLYLGEAHKEALALLRYGVIERKGFILLTGEVGTGKTTMAQAFLTELDKRVHCIYLSNPLLTSEDLYNYLAFSAFRKRVIYKSKASFMLDFEAFLKERLKNQEVFILIIDEAQRLSYELLEEIRLLSNMETAEEKLINIFLIGQPELNKKLNDPRCRPLLQRISVRYHIKPLNLDETIEYLSTRLRVAGVDEMGEIFPKKVAEAIYEYSQGYPRVINILADNVLLLSFSKSEREIKPEFVKQCYDDMQLEGSFLARDRTEKKQRESQKVVPISSGRLKRLALLALILVLGLVGFLGGFEISERGRAVLSEIETDLPGNGKVRQTVHAGEKATEAGLAEESGVEPNVVGKEARVVELPDAKLEAEHKEGTVEKPSAEKTPVEKTVATPVDNSAGAQSRKDGAADMSIKTVTAVSPEEVEPLREDPSLEFITVTLGDTLTGLAVKHYGRVDAAILDLLRDKNPQIRNINHIEIGQRIVFPSLFVSSDPGESAVR